jgi:hypothetical protein
MARDKHQDLRDRHIEFFNVGEGLADLEAIHNLFHFKNYFVKITNVTFFAADLYTQQ